MDREVVLKESVLEDLRSLGRANGRAVLRAALSFLGSDPLAETQNLKSLRPNPFAQRELRVRGRYRVLFNVDREQRKVTILLVGEKRGNRLLVRGEEFKAHEDSRPE